LELARPSVYIVRRRPAGEAAAYAPPGAAVLRLEQFAEPLSLKTTDLGTFEQRLVRICNRLYVELIQRPPGATGLPSSFRAAWLDATRDAGACVGPVVVTAIEDAAHLVAEERRTDRDKLLEDLALQRISTETGPQHSKRSAGPMAPSTTPGVWRNRCAQPGASR
jgi:hypothetical protein